MGIPLVHTQSSEEDGEDPGLAFGFVALERLWHLGVVTLHFVQFDAWDEMIVSVEWRYPPRLAKLCTHRLDRNSDDGPEDAKPGP